MNEIIKTEKMKGLFSSSYFLYYTMKNFIIIEWEGLYE